MASSLSLLLKKRPILAGTLCTLFAFCICYSTLLKHQSTNLIQAMYLAESDENCRVEWKNEKLRPVFFEAPMLESSDIHKKDFVRDSKPVKHIYRHPAIPLNPDKFLLPVLEYGPNNQLIGFRTAAFVAIKLNRTFVIPKFFKHFSDSQKSSGLFIYPGHRVEVENLCKFISCITLDQFQRACGRKIDAIVNLHNFIFKDVKQIERKIGMQITEQYGEDDEELSKINFIPPSSFQSNKTFREFHPEEIESLFKSDERCVIYPYPLYNLKMPFGRRGSAILEADLVDTVADIKKYPPSILLQSITHHSPSPKYITKIAKDFISSIIGGRPYIGVHWRYNKEDFMKRCRNKKGDDIKYSLCSNAMSIQPVHIALAIEEKIIELRNLPEPIAIEDIYIASPPSERLLVAEVAKILRDQQGWTTISSIELEKFMKAEFLSCADLQRHFNDIVSTTEMELCIHSYAFLGSTRSSWTSNVRVARRTIVDENVRKKYDDSIYTTAGKQLEKTTPP